MGPIWGPPTIHNRCHVHSQHWGTRQRERLQLEGDGGGVAGLVSHCCHRRARQGPGSRPQPRLCGRTGSLARSRREQGTMERSSAFPSGVPSSLLSAPHTGAVLRSCSVSAFVFARTHSFCFLGGDHTILCTVPHGLTRGVDGTVTFRSYSEHRSGSVSQHAMESSVK